MKSLRRHLLLWLGLLPGIFILWAWVDSTRNLTQVDGMVMGRGCAIACCKHSLVFGFTHEPHLAAWALRRGPVNYKREPGIWRGNLMLESSEMDPAIYGPAGKHTRVFIPHVLVFTGWLILFILFLAARRKLRRKRGRAPLEVPASSAG